MFDRLKAGETEFLLDPETVFWGTGEESALRPVHAQLRGQLLAEMHAHRFAVEPLLWYVNPTDACNARCAYCYLPQQVKSRSRSMSEDELNALTVKAHDFFKKLGVKGSLIFHGTEPMLIKQRLFDLMRKHADSFHFGIQTNGLLLTPEDIAFLKEHKINLGVSLDSPFAATNDALRGPGHFDQVSRVLDWCEGYKGLNVVTTVSSYNLRDLEAMVDFLHAKGVGLCLMNPVRGTQEAARALRPDPLLLAQEFRKAVERAIDLTKQGRRIVIGDFANILLGIVAPSARVMMCDISPCGAGRRFFSITADGAAYPCGEFIGMRDFLGGNMFEQDGAEIMDSEAFRRVRARKVEDIPECAACPVRNICGAPCPAEILSTDGSMSAKSYYCEFYRLAVEHAFEIIARNDVGSVLKTSALKEIYRLESGGGAG